jgi:hypothetical protein
VFVIIFLTLLLLHTTGSGNQTSDVSWWPKPETWENSPLNVGYWSPNCEEWFCERLDHIRTGSSRGGPRSGSTWTSDLKKWRRTPHVVASSKQAAAAFIESHCASC